MEDKIIRFKDDKEYDEWLCSKKDKTFLELITDGLVVYIGDQLYIQNEKKVKIGKKLIKNFNI